jgi:hypothetical protein
VVKYLEIQEINDCLPDFEVQWLLWARSLSRLGCGRLSDECVKERVDCFGLADVMIDDLLELWAAALLESELFGSLEFWSCGWPIPAEIFEFLSDSKTELNNGRLVVNEKFDAVRSAAYAAGLESLIDAYMSGVPLDDLLVGCERYGRS